jgi:hypothetical protein
MLNVVSGPNRRAVLRLGLLGATGLALPDLLRAAETSPGRPASEKSVILIWLDGGPSQLETFDPKPDAPAEFRGPYGVTKTRYPGVFLSELMPLTAERMERVALVRSLHHDNGDHFAAAHWMTTGRLGSTAASLPQKYPSFGSYIARVKGQITPGMPAYVGLPSAETVYLFPGYLGAAYLGGQYNPFDVDRESKYLASNGPNIGSPKWIKALGTSGKTLAERNDLLKQFDTFRRAVDASGIAGEMDRFQQQALDMVLGSKAREAFDIDQEEPRHSDRYGQGPWARYTLMARRLVEAGVRVVTVDMPHWDDHSNIKETHGRKVPVVDRALAGLLDDLSERGLLESTIVLVMGEFGRTPRINTGQPGIPIPGRDHWGNAISALIAGGGIPGGVVVGKTNDKAEHPVERALLPGNLLATVYHHLGVDPSLTFKDHSGRPVPILDDGDPIKELI